MKLLLVLIPALAVAAPLYQLEAGLYKAEISPANIPPFGGPPFLVSFSGPNGTFTYSFRTYVFTSVILGSEGVLAISGGNLGAWAGIVRYGQASDHVESLTINPCFDHYGHACFGGGGHFEWAPLLYIQYGRLFGEMRAYLASQFGDPPVYGLPVIDIQYTHDYGIQMGTAAIPEPATFGLLLLGLGAIARRSFRLSRITNRCMIPTWTCWAPSEISGAAARHARGDPPSAGRGLRYRAAAERGRLRHALPDRHHPRLDRWVRSWCYGSAD